MDLLDRLSDKMLIGDGCWLWTASTLSSGYGSVFHDGKARLAHRVVYELMAGPIPDGLQLDHLCRVPACVRPDHLEPVTCRTNILRGIGTSAQNAVKSHCPEGHPLSGDNLYVRPDGRRNCRACHRERNRLFMRTRKKAK